MAEPALTAAAAEFLYREARLLDAGKFGEWLDLFADDAIFWVPAVGMDRVYTSEPETSLNFIYIVGRAGLEARVFRVESGGSLASNPLPQTRHLVTNVMVDRRRPGRHSGFRQQSGRGVLRAARPADPQRLVRVSVAPG